MGFNRGLLHWVFDYGNGRKIGVNAGSRAEALGMVLSNLNRNFPLEGSRLWTEQDVTFLHTRRPDHPRPDDQNWFQRLFRMKTAGQRGWDWAEELIRRRAEGHEVIYAYEMSLFGQYMCRDTGMTPSPFDYHFQQKIRPYYDELVLADPALVSEMDHCFGMPDPKRDLRARIDQIEAQLDHPDNISGTDNLQAVTKEQHRGRN